VQKLVIVLLLQIAKRTSSIYEAYSTCVLYWAYGYDIFVCLEAEEDISIRCCSICVTTLRVVDTWIVRRPWQSFLFAPWCLYQCRNSRNPTTTSIFIPSSSQFM